MESFLIAVNAVLPLVIYLMYGYLARVVGWFGEENMKKLSQLIFRAFFPLLMFRNMYYLDAGSFSSAGFTLYAVLSVLVPVGIMVLTVPHIVRDRSRTGVVIQALYRGNIALFALPMTQSIYGDAGMPPVTLLVAVIVPLYNVLAVIILEYYGGKATSFRHLLLNLVKNPFIIGISVGLVVRILQIKLPQVLLVPVDKFADMATPLALFVLGGTLHFSQLRGYLKYLVPCISIRMILLPFIDLTLATLLGFSPMERFILATVYMTSVATASYPMAMNMGGDAALAGQFVVFSTIASVFTLFGWIYLLGSLQMLF